MKKNKPATSNRDLTERNIIASLLVLPDRFPTARKHLQPENFKDPLFRKVIQSAHHCSDRGIPFEIGTIRSHAGLSEDEVFTLASLMADSHVGGYLPMLAEELTAVTIHEKFLLFRSGIDEGADIFELLEQSEKLINEATVLLNRHRRRDKLTLLQDYITYLHDNQTNGLKRIPTPFDTVNRMLKGGLELGGYSLVGGSPGQGKTSFLLGIALRAAEANYKVTLIEGEMPMNEILERLNGIKTGIDIDEIRKGQRYDELSKGFCSDLFNLPLELVSISERSPAALLSAIREAAHAGAELILVDYLQVFAQKGGSSDKEYAEIKVLSETLRGLSMRNNIHIMASSSFNRNESGKDRTTLASLYGSSGLGHDATRVMVLTGEQSDLAELKNPERNVTLSILKNRGGARGDIALRYQLDSQRMEELGPEDGSGLAPSPADDIFTESEENGEETLGL